MAARKTTALSKKKAALAKALWYSPAHCSYEKIAEAVGATPDAVKALIATEPGLCRIIKQRWVDHDGNPLTPQALHRRRVRSCGVPAGSPNATAAYAERTTVGFKGGIHFLPLSPEQYHQMEMRAAGVVRQCEQAVADLYGIKLSVAVRLDTSKLRSRSWGGSYTTRWQTERLQKRERGTVNAGINIAVNRKVSLESDDLFAAGKHPEYGRMRRFGDIGETTLFSPFDMVIVHEMSHAVHFAWLGLSLGELPRCMAKRSADKERYLTLGIAADLAEALRHQTLPEEHRLPGPPDQWHQLKPHGLTFNSIYAALRGALGFIDPAKPLFTALDVEARIRAVGYDWVLPNTSGGRPQARPEGTEGLDDAAYKREMARRRQAARRERLKAAEAAP